MWEHRRLRSAAERYLLEDCMREYYSGAGERPVKLPLVTKDQHSARMFSKASRLADRRNLSNERLQFLLVIRGLYI